LGESLNAKEVQQLKTRLGDKFVQFAFSFAMNRLLSHIGKTCELEKLKSRIIHLVELYPKCCIKVDDVDYVPMNQLLKECHLHPDKDVLKAFLIASPNCVLHADPEGFTTIHLLMQCVEPDYEAILLILQHCPQSASSRTLSGESALRMVIAHPLHERHPDYRTYLSVLSMLLRLSPDCAFEEITETITKMRVERGAPTVIQPVAPEESLASTLMTTDSFDELDVDDRGDGENGVEMGSEVEEVPATTRRVIAIQRSASDDAPPLVRRVIAIEHIAEETELSNAQPAGRRVIAIQHTSSDDANTQIPTRRVIAIQHSETHHEETTFRTVTERVTVTWTPVLRMLESEDMKIRNVAQNFLDSLGHKRRRMQWSGGIHSQGFRL